MKYVHKSTSLGTIEIKGDGLQVDCVTTVIRMPDRGLCLEQEIHFQMYNKAPDHAGGMKPLIDAALQKGKELADAYIAARVVEVPTPVDFTKRTTIFACGAPAGADGSQREFETYVQDFDDPALRWLTLAIAVGTDNEKHIVMSSGDLKGFLSAMAELQATPFNQRANSEAA